MILNTKKIFLFEVYWILVLLIFVFIISCNISSEDKTVERIYIASVNSILDRYDEIVLSGAINSRRAYSTSIYKVDYNLFLGIGIKKLEPEYDTGLKIPSTLPNSALTILSEGFGELKRIQVGDPNNIEIFREIRDEHNVPGTLIFYEPYFVEKNKCYVAIGDYPRIFFFLEVIESNDKWIATIINNNSENSIP